MLTASPKWRGLGNARAGLGADSSVSVSAAGCTVTDPVSGASTFFADCALPASAPTAGVSVAFVLGCAAAVFLGLLLSGGRR